MPTLPIYIRVDDLDKWKALENKSEFVHKALNPNVRPVTKTEAKEIAEVFTKPKKSMFNDSDDWKPLFKKSGKL